MIEYFHWDGYRRVEEMFLYRQLGMSLAKIGKKYGITTERVRQILVKRERNSMANHLNSEPDKNFLSPRTETRYAALMRARELNQIAQPA